MKQSLTDKYRPETLESVAGHPSTIKKIKKWAEEWNRGDSPLLLYGDAGTGKTSTAEALANDMEWNYIEINASEKRRKEDINTLIQQIRSISNEPRLFLLDEVDSIDGKSLSDLYKVINDSPNPIICTANEKWKVPDGLEEKCIKYKFNLRKDSIKSYLRDVANAENIDITSRQLGQLATRNGIRDALNDLEEFSKSGKTDWDARDTDDSPFAVTRRAILNKDYLGDMTPDDMVAFLNENVKDEFAGVENLRAYQAIAEADTWLGKVNRSQNYSWWKYAGPVVEEVSNLRLTEPYNDWVNVNYPKSRRNHTPQADSGSDEAKLYQEIKEYDGYTASFDFQEFRNIVLPMMQEWSESDKKQFILSYSLSNDSMAALDIDKSEFDDWEMEETENGTYNQEKVSDYVSNDTTDGGEKGLFDF